MSSSGPGAHQADFETFFAEVEPLLRRALVARYGHEAGREACADALAFAWQHWAEVRGIRNPVGYLYRVGQSASRRYLKKPHRLLPPPRESRDQWFEPGLAGALASLTDRQRAAVVLVDGYGMTLAEVASLLGLRRSSIQNHLRRGRRRLRDALTNMEET